MSQSEQSDNALMAEKQERLEAFTKAMYARVTAEWEKSRPRLRKVGDWGFAILSSPPRYRARLAILGENPGFGTKDKVAPDTLPTRNSYIDADWPLAAALRRLFEAAGRMDTLQGAVISNFQFFKSPSLKAWRRLAPDHRRHLEEVSRQEVEQLIRLSEPRRLWCSAWVLSTGSRATRAPF